MVLSVINAADTAFLNSNRRGTRCCGFMYVVG